MASTPTPGERISTIFKYFKQITSVSCVVSVTFNDITGRKYTSSEKHESVRTCSSLSSGLLRWW